MPNDPPSPRAFTLEVTAAPADIDALGHVSNLVYLRWVQEVAEAHSSAVGLDLAGYQRLGAIFLVRKHELEYLAPVRAGERIALTTWIASWRGPSAERHTRFERLDDGRQVARAVTHWVYVAMESGRPRRIPQEVAVVFGEGETERKRPER